MKKVVLLIKVLVLAAVAGFVGYKIYESWDAVSHTPLRLQWGYTPLALLGFAGVMLTSGVVWRRLVWRMGESGPLVGMLGAYAFSQMGKYVPGKVMLLVMRINRAGRYGISAKVCTLSTLLENVLYMISGGLAGLLALQYHARDLASTKWAWVQPASAVAVVLLAGMCHPRVFYGLFNRGVRTVNAALAARGKPPIAEAAPLGMGTLLMAVLRFMPCWIFGGLAMWASARCVHGELPLVHMLPLMGAFALSVILGMLSPLPAGLGVRDAVLILFVSWELAPYVGDNSEAYAAIAVALQRCFQMTTEAGLGLVGAAVTAGPAVPVTTAEAQRHGG